MMLSRRRKALLQQQLIIMISILIIVQKQLQDMVVAAADNENYGHYLIACGDNNKVDNSAPTLDGRSWSSDDPEYYSSSSMAATAAVDRDSSGFEIPFLTGRVSQANFTYKFPVKPGPKFIRLYFYSSTYNSSSGGSSDSSSISRDRFFFSVVSNTGAVLLQNFTAAKATEKDSSHMRREFFLTIHPTTSSLELTFSPNLPSYYALVNGIEVVSASLNLLYPYSHSDAGPPPPSSVPPKSYQLQNFSIGEWSSLETMYRVNVGGPELQPSNDSAGYGSGRMYRHWDSDDIYELVGPGYSSGQPAGYRFPVNYSASSTPEYVAPAEVYMTGKEIGKTNFRDVNQQMMVNLTWKFEVDVGFSYLVRLHWCEVDGTVTTQVKNKRVFNVYINNQMAEQNIDLMGTGWGNGSKGIPIYRDYAVYQEQGGDNHLLLALRPVPTGLVNVMLNGVEIFKANKLDGSLATPNTNPLPPLLFHNDSNSSHSHHHHPHHLVVVVIVIIVVVVVVVGIILLSLLLFRRSSLFSIYGSSTYKSTTSKYGTKTTTTTNSSWWGLPRAYKGSSTSPSSSSKLLPSDLCRRFSLNQIRSATCDFSESLLIGSGGFGSVYKGTIDLINNNNNNNNNDIPSNNVKDDDDDDGDDEDRGSNTKPSSSVIQVAIKRLNQRTSKQGAREFITEIEMLSRLRHAHLVPLIGYCDDQGEMVLVYEYMPRGTLRDHLNIVVGQHHHNPTHLSWERRLSICIGAAKGLHYLHSGARHMVIHRDVKSTNILLDHNWAAKVADFGLSKLVVPPPAGEFGLGGGDIVQQLPQYGITTAVKGSFGYVDPEYFKRQHLTEKSDVYSFGVVLFEVLCGRPAIDPTLPKDQVNLAMWARMCHRRGCLDQIMDPNLFNTLNNNIISPSPDSLKKFGDIAEMCVRDQGIDRPSMADVLWGLEFSLELQTTSSNSSVIPPTISNHHQIIIEDNCAQRNDHSKSNFDDNDTDLLHTTTATTTTTSTAAVNSTTITSNNSSHIVFSHLKTTTAHHQDSNDGEDFTSGSVFSEIITPQPR